MTLLRSFADALRRHGSPFIWTGGRVESWYVRLAYGPNAREAANDPGDNAA